MAPLASVLKVRANLVGLVVFDRTRVSFALTQAEFPEHVKNLTAFDFHLTREIVNSNLAHPPLFRMCYPKPFSRPGVPNDWSSSLGWSKLPLGIGSLRYHHYHLNGVEKRDAYYASPSSFSTLVLFNSFVRAGDVVDRKFFSSLVLIFGRFFQHFLRILQFRFRSSSHGLGGLNL